MAVDCFLKLDDIKGESADQKHVDHIDVLSWTWGASQTATFQSGSGGGTAKVTVGDLVVTKYIDRSTPALLGLCFTGKPIKSAVLTMRKAGGEQVEYLRVTMEDAVVASIKSNSTPGQERLTEDLSLNFARVKFDYIPQKSDGAPDAAVKFGYDIAKNVKWG
jgi:type VI secretion system secreted protein Hcp